MNDNEKEIKVKNSDLAEQDSFNQAMASRDALIREQKETIKFLKQEVGKREVLISGQMREIDREKTARIEAESKIAESKNLEKTIGVGNKYSPKTEEEKFAEKYNEACQRIRSKIN